VNISDGLSSCPTSNFAASSAETRSSLMVLFAGWPSFLKKPA